MSKFLENWNKFLEEGDYQKDIDVDRYLRNRKALTGQGGAEPSAPFTVDPPATRAKSAPPGFGGSLEEVDVEEDKLFKPLSKHQKAHVSKLIRVKYKDKPLDKDGIIDPDKQRHSDSICDGTMCSEMHKGVPHEEYITEEKKKNDRCVRIAKRKYKAWPSAYASGAVVKCRQGKIWKKEK